MTELDTGLDLESFLLLMRADLGAWALLGAGNAGPRADGLAELGFAPGFAQVFGPFGRGPRGTCPLRQHGPRGVPRSELGLA